MSQRTLGCLAEDGNYSKFRIGAMLAILACLGCVIWLICLSVTDSKTKVNCDVTEWSEWNTCSVTCGKGKRSRNRQIRSAPLNGGKACPVTIELTDCNAKQCPNIVCETTACNIESQRFSKMMDIEADPCEDFNQFVCGNLDNKFDKIFANPDKGYKQAWNKAKKNVLNVGKKLFEESLEGDNTFESDHKVQEQYRLCMDQDKREELGVNPLRNTLKNIGGWPVLQEGRGNLSESWFTGKHYKWYEHISMIRQHGYISPSYGLLDLELEIHSQDYSKNMLIVDFPVSLFKNKKFLFEGRDNKYTQKYFDIMVKAAVLLGAPQETSKNELMEVLKFEIELASLGKQNYFLNQKDMPHSKQNLKMYRSLFSNEKEVIYTNFNDLKRSMQAMSNDKSTDLSSTLGKILQLWLMVYRIDTNGNEKVKLMSSEYLQELPKLLSKYRNKPYVIANYLNWLVIEEGLGYLNNAATGLKSELDDLYCQFKNGDDYFGCKENDMVQMSYDMLRVHCMSTLGYDPGLFGRDETDILYWSILSGSLFVRKYFRLANKELVTNIAEFEREAIRDMISNASWLTDTSRKHAMEKLDEMSQTIAYPDAFVNETRLKEALKEAIPTRSFYRTYNTACNPNPGKEYPSLAMAESACLNNTKCTIIMENKCNGKTFTLCEGSKVEPMFGFCTWKKRYQKNDFGFYENMLEGNIRTDQLTSLDPRKVAPLIYATLVNAVYYRFNGFVINAGIIQGYFFNPLAPNYINFGAIGSVLAHEIMHGFDTNGVKFGKNGSHFDLLDAQSKEKYTERKNCLIEQYGKYKIGDVSASSRSIGDALPVYVNGTLTINENIADTGVRASYNAYVKWLRENGDEQRLPGFSNFTNRQMFWISWARAWCGKYNDFNSTYVFKHMNPRAVHSPGKYRILGPLQNDENFAKDFKCSPESRMHPKNKCIFW